MAKMGRPKSENPKIRKLTVKMENDLYDEFTKECEKINAEKSTLIRNWIIEFLENKKK
ncbi:CopG family transcriptional regulator [Holdemania sp. 1001095H_141210_F2]|uniref:CopG family transcriptional regulator n=1 Tax=Holdemania sp. 1001095H_141210_F2 TaxID=2787149 RepID=UPI0018A07D9F|nr:CopG family transcriptional regulator [Holdemania sp. 1001095H_141210_F2]